MTYDQLKIRYRNYSSVYFSLTELERNSASGLHLVKLMQEVAQKLKQYETGINQRDTRAT